MHLSGPSTEKDSGTHIMVIGDPVNGFRFIGPTEPGNEYLEQWVDTFLAPSCWWYASLKKIIYNPDNGMIEDVA